MASGSGRDIVVPRIAHIVVDFCGVTGLILCGPRLSRPRTVSHVFPQEDLGRPRLSANRREPARGRGGPPAGDRDPRADRGSAGERATGAASALGARFAEKAIVLDAVHRGEATVVSTRR